MNHDYDPDFEELLIVYFAVDGKWNDQENNELWWAHKCLLDERDASRAWEVKVAVKTKVAGNQVVSVGRFIF